MMQMNPNQQPQQQSHPMQQQQPPPGQSQPHQMHPGAPGGQVPMQQQQQPPPQTNAGQQSHSAPASEARQDHVTKVRSLVWTLKESLANLMKTTASCINHNSLVDSGSKTNDDNKARFDKALEEFFATCNQIELLLKTINECAIQHRESLKYLQHNVSTLKADNENIGNDNIISYSQYISTIKGQIHFAKNVQEILMEGAKRMLNEPLPHPPMQTQQAPLPPQQQQQQPPPPQMQHQPQVSLHQQMGPVMGPNANVNQLMPPVNQNAMMNASGQG